MAHLATLHPPISLALAAQQLTPQQAWELDQALLSNLPLTAYGQRLLTWCLLLDCPTELLPSH